NSGTARGAGRMERLILIHCAGDIIIADLVLPGDGESCADAFPYTPQAPVNMPGIRRKPTRVGFLARCGQVASGPGSCGCPVRAPSPGILHSAPVASAKRQIPNGSGPRPTDARPPI